MLSTGQVTGLHETQYSYVFLIVEIDVSFVEFHDFSDLADVAANVWAISAPKMEGA